MKIEYKFTADLEIESEIKTLTAIVSITELEGDCNIWDILTDKLEKYIQNNYCFCSFNESQNHCDCNLGDYEVLDIIDSKIVAK